MPSLRLFQSNGFAKNRIQPTAQSFLDAGTFYWNSGIFVWKAKTVLDAMKQFVPEMYAHIERIANSIGTDDYQQTLDTEFTAIKGTSIDYAVMEHYDNVMVVEAPFEWDDLGNWTAVPRLRGVRWGWQLH